MTHDPPPWPWPPPPAGEPGATPPGPSRRRIVVAVVAVVVVTALIAVSVLARPGRPARSNPARGSSTDDAERVLESARRFVDDASTVRFRRTVTDASDGSGPTLVHRAEAELPDRSRVRVSLTAEEQETVYAGDEAFYRDARTADALATEPWVSPGGARGDVVPGEGSLARDVEVPHRLPLLLARAHDPRITDRGADGTRVAVALADRQIDGAVGRVTLDGEGRVVEITVDLPGGDGSPGVESTLSSFRWDASVHVEVPDPDEMDETPEIDEEALAAFRDAPLLQPVRIPEGWAFAGADVVPAEQTREGCAQGNLTYRDRTGAGFVEVYLFPEGCSQGPGDGAVPLTAGERTGWVVPGDPTSLAEIPVDGSIVQVVTTLAAADVERVFADLEPFDADAPPEAVLAPRVTA